MLGRSRAVTAHPPEGQSFLYEVPPLSLLQLLAVLLNQTLRAPPSTMGAGEFTVGLLVTFALTVYLVRS